MAQGVQQTLKATTSFSTPSQCGAHYDCRAKSYVTLLDSKFYLWRSEMDWERAWLADSVRLRRHQGSEGNHHCRGRDGQAGDGSCRVPECGKCAGRGTCSSLSAPPSGARQEIRLCLEQVGPLALNKSDGEDIQVKI